MSLDDPSVRTFLEELHRRTIGDMQAQASMYEVGAAMGLGKSEAGTLAEELMVAGLVELRTLSGGISITLEGLSFLGIAAPTTTSADTNQKFSDGPAANKADREILCRLIDTMKTSLSGLKTEYKQLEEIIIDLKTIEVQLLSPFPKVAILRELLRSLHSSFQAIGNKALTALLAPHIR
ncbi:MAG: hypothetical protein KJ630_21800 [Proteobacteria bacterium]|nr:hypothetical protein [Pseudomonadota bacterium]